MLNIFKYEFKTYYQSIFIWVISLAAITFIMFSFFPTFGSDASIMEKILENYPEEMLKAFGMSGGLPLSSVLGYLVFVFAFVQLFLAIQSSNYGFSILSIEEREFTADFLMSKPVSRISILSAKFIAALLALIITNIFVCIIMFAAIEMFKNGQVYEVSHLLILLSSMIMFQLFFLSIGMLVSVLTKRIRSVLAFSMGLSFGMYMINAIGAIIGGNIMTYISPFSHFEPGYILEYGKYDMSLVPISIIIILVSIVGTYVLYPRRDIHSL